jgi:polynucleotide 5'-hydroxyl-kinase GRC3/NOL9
MQASARSEDPVSTGTSAAGDVTSVRLDIPAAWRHSADRIVAKNWRRILVVGAADRGKSSYCNFLVDALLTAGRTASFIDADIGQKDVGPPATVSLADLDAPAVLAQTSCSALAFVGHVSPVAHFLPLVLGTRHMMEAARGEVVVIDTAGLVQGKGRVLKGFQIESLQPDVLVCLERGEELAPIRHAARHLNILRLRPSRFAAAKSSNARRRAREAAFRRHFQEARELEFGLEEIVVQRASLFNGEPVDDARFLYAERLPDGLLAVMDGPVPSGERVESVPPHCVGHLLCGVADKLGNCLGLGIVSAVDFARRRLMLYTPVSKRDIRIVQFGDMYLDRQGHELHLGRMGHF